VFTCVYILIHLRTDIELDSERDCFDDQPAEMWILSTELLLLSAILQINVSLCLPDLNQWILRADNNTIDFRESP